MMPLTSPPRTSSASSYRATESLPSSQHVYQAVPDFTPQHPSSTRYQNLTPLLYRRSNRRLTVLRHPRGCNLVRSCTLASQITRMLLYNGCSAVFSVIGAVIVWTMATLSVLTIPLFGCGIAVFDQLLHVVFYLCCTEAVIYNALATTAADCIDMDLAEWGVTAGGSYSEQQHLLPIRVRVPAAAGEQVFEPCPRFERSLGTSSPRSVLATVYFGCVKLFIGAGQILAVILVLAVLGFLIGDKRVPIHLERVTIHHPFAVYTAAFGLLLVSLALLHGVTKVAKVVTRFFCCEAV